MIDLFLANKLICCFFIDVEQKLCRMSSWIISLLWLKQSKSKCVYVQQPRMNGAAFLFNMPGCRIPGFHNTPTGNSVHGSCRRYCPRWYRHDRSLPFPQYPHDRKDHPEGQTIRLGSPSQRIGFLHSLSQYSGSVKGFNCPLDHIPRFDVRHRCHLPLQEVQSALPQ